MATYAKKGETIENLIKRFKREVVKGEILTTYRNKEFYLSNGQKKRLKIERSKKRSRAKKKNN